MDSHQDNIAELAVEVPKAPPQVLLVEDEDLFARAVAKRLSKAGLTCEIAGTLAAARNFLKLHAPTLMLLDMRLPDGSGLDFLAEFRARAECTDIPVIVMTAYGELEDAVSAMKLEARDYLKKPVDLDELLLNVTKVLQQDASERQLRYSKVREHRASDAIEFIGEHAGVAAVREQVGRIGELSQAPDLVPPTVLILGETGTGKDVVARLLHAGSALADRPFVHVDCASLPKDLIEAELFGHVKGAFTNAQSDRAGLIEAAENGVVFLDEIGELPSDLQTKLLAVLERRRLRRVGSSQERPTAAWFIAATNRDVQAMVAAGQFRSDLYYRLNVLSIELPPLRERGDDALLLVRHFAGHTATRYGLPAPSLTQAAEQAVRAYRWPGNVRELKHVVERAVLLAGGGQLDADDLALQAVASEPAAGDAAVLSELDAMTLEEMERYLIERALERSGSNISEAARQLGITRMAMRHRVKKYGFD